MMNPAMKPEILSRQMIKPSTPSPDHKSIHSLCFFEQLNSTIYMPFVFFYSASSIAHKSVLLKETLSAALSKYYPLAGRIKDTVTINCNNEGVEFVEARIKLNLSDVLKYPSHETITFLLPDDLQYKDPFLSSLLIVQVTYFGCGGMALTLCFSHKITDMAGQCSFINSWAAMARNSTIGEIVPLFNLGFLYPSIELPILSYQIPEKVKCISRRLVFEPSKIAKLKATVANKVKNPTRVEVVTALLCKSAMSAARAISRSSKPAIMHQAIHLRSRVSPPVPESSMGCFTAIFPVSISEDSVIELAELVNKFRQEKTEFCNKLKDINVEEFYSFILERSSGVRECKSKNVYMCSSWCGFPIYEADFGWGKPVWVTHPVIDARNIICLMDTAKGKGIEAFLSLEEKEMAVFECDEELLAFAKINPSVLDSHSSEAEIALPRSRM